MPPTMRATRCTGPQQIELGSLPVPEPAAGEVRLRVEACGICGSDLHLLGIGYLGNGAVPGHEMAGIVETLGAGVDGVAPGDRVAVEPLASCGRCVACRERRYAVCPEGQIYGVHRNGGMADYVTVPARHLFPVPPDLSAPLAALAEPMAVVVHGLRRAGFARGQRILVLGAGTLGLMTALAARWLGAHEVWLTARYPHQAALATELGATRVLSEAEATREELRALGRKLRFDGVVESVGGRAETLNLAAEAVCPGGTISVVGFFMPPVSVDPLLLFAKEATLAWSNCYDHTHEEADFQTGIRLLDAERERLLRITTHQVSLDDVQEAYRLAADRKAGAVKVSILTS